MTHALCDPSCSGSGMSDEYNELLRQDAAPAAWASQQKRPFRKKRKRGGTDVHSGFNDMGKNKAKKRDAAADTDGDPESGAVDDQTGKHGGVKVWSKDGDSNDEKWEVSEEERAIQLSEFQASVVLKAITFPSIERVSYSTCSIYEQENEQMVARILEACPDFQVVKALPAWPRRGIKPELYPFADKVLRADRKLDGTTGFFVALFARKAGAAATATAQTAAVEAAGAGNKKKKKKKRNRKRKQKNDAGVILGDAAEDGEDDDAE